MRYLALFLAILIALFPLEVLAEGRFNLVSPPADQDHSGKSVEIAVSYNTGSSESVTFAELSIDGKRQSGKYIEAPKPRGIVSFIWDTTGMSNGSHSILVKLYSGNKLLGSVCGSGRVGNKPIDVIPPTVGFTNIKPNETITGTKSLKFYAKDNSGEPPVVSVSVDDDVRLITNDPPYDYDWDSTEYADGAHTVAAWGYDNSGNRGDAGSVKVVVKNGIKSKAVKVEPEKPVLAARAEVKDAPKQEAKANTAPVVPSIEGKDSNSIAARAVEPAIKESAPAPAAVKVEPVTASPAVPALKDVPTKLALLPPVVGESSSEVTAPVKSAPRVAVPAQQRMAMLPSVDTIEAPAASISPEASAAPVVTSSGRKSAAVTADVRSSGRLVQSTAKIVAPSTGDKPVMMAKVVEDAPVIVTRKPATKAAAKPQLITGTVKLVMGETGVKLAREANSSVPAAALRDVMKQLNDVVIWDKDTRTITAYHNGMRITMRVGDSHAIVNGKKVKLSAPVTISDEKALVDLRFLNKVLKMEMKYNPKARDLYAQPVELIKSNLVAVSVNAYIDAKSLIDSIYQAFSNSVVSST